MEVHHQLRGGEKQSKAEKKRKREEKEVKRMEKEYKRRYRKEKRARREVEKCRRLFSEEEQEDPPRNVLTANSRRAAVEGAEAAVYDLGGGIRVEGVTGKKKIPVKDVLRVTKMVAAALFADDVDDFMHNYLQDFRFDTNAVDLAVGAIQILNTAYDRSADILGGSKNVECGYARTCATPFHQPSAYREEADGFVAPLSPAPSNDDGVDTTNPLIIDEEAEEKNMENQEKTARIKRRMLEEEVGKMLKRTPVKNDEEPERFYMLTTPPTEDEAAEDDDAVGGGFSPPHRPAAYDTVTPPPPEVVFRTPVGVPPSIWRRGVGRNNNNAGRPLRAAAILARQREQQRLTRGGSDSSFSPSSAEEDFLNDSNYEPATTDFGSDSEFDIEGARRLRVV